MRLLCVFLMAALMAPTAWSATQCPLGKNEDHLTLVRVMQNFGRVLLAADRIAQNEAGTEAEFNAALDGIQTAEVCAQAVLDDPQGRLWPDRAADMQGPQLEAYIARFHGHMADFLEGLAIYEGAIRDQQVRPAANREFTAIRNAQKDVRDRANRAHDDLFYN